MAIQDRDFERMMNEIRLFLTGSSDAGIKATMFDVIDEFFDVSNSWVEWIPLTIQPGLQIYSLLPQKGGMINRLVTALDSNQVVLPAGIAFGDQPASTSAGPSSYVDPPGVVLSLTFPQNTSYTASVCVTKKLVLPTNSNEVPNAPSWLLPLYERYLKEGVIGTMQLQKGKSYYDPTALGAPYHLKKFRDGMAMAKTATIRSGIFGGQSWGFPRLYRTNSQRGGVSTPFPTPTGQGI
jgi:hypothetical protein